MEVNPGTFHIPEEYAVVQKPVRPQYIPQSAAPDVIPKRRNQTISTKVPNTQRKVTFNDLSASVGGSPSSGVMFDGGNTYGILSEARSGPQRSHNNRIPALIRRTSELTFDDRDISCTGSATGEEVVRRRLSSRREKGPEVVEVEVFLTEGEDTLRGVLELSTLHHDIVDKVKIRVVFLIDVSGSMLLKCGRSRTHSKLAKLKKMAADVVDVLEEGDDYLGVVTFGDDTRVVCPLTKVDSVSRAELKEAITGVDKSIDSKTDLVSGVQKAVEILRSGTQAYDPSYHNAIIVFSDGEINSGTMDPDDVVHEIRQRIRDTNPMTANPNNALWVNVACVTTGGNVSEAMYLVSKHCGNDAYYYVDSDLAHPEVDMLVPLLQRKAAIAQFINVDISSDNGAKIVTDKCTREFSVRRRKEEKKSTKMLYFLHDLQAGSQRHFSIVVDLKGHPKQSDSDVVVINMDYVDASGETHSVKRTVKYGDRLTPLKDPEKYEKGVLLSAKADMRSVFQNVCRDAAEFLQSNDEGSPNMALSDGKEKLHQLMERYGLMAKREETKAKIADFSRALIDNLDKLIESMEKSRRGSGHKWTKIKAVASAVVRETPTVSKLVSHSESLCPLPVFKSCQTTRMTALALKLYRKQEVTSVVFPNQNLFDAAKVVMQNLGDIVSVLNEVESVPRDSQTLRRNIITSMVISEGDLSDD